MSFSVAYLYASPYAFKNLPLREYHIYAAALQCLHPNSFSSITVLAASLIAPFRPVPSLQRVFH